MSTKDRLKAAMEAIGIEVTGTYSTPRRRTVGGTAMDLAEAVDSMILEAVAAEREACAAIADNFTAPNTAAAIRARGEAQQ